MAVSAEKTEPIAPHVGPWLLLFAVAGAPAAWSAHLLINYGLASQPCYPGHAPLAAGSASPILLVAIDLIAIVVALAAGLVGFRIWRRYRYTGPGGFEDLMHLGEGRARFLGMWGVMFSIAFLAAILFDTIALLLVPSCAY
jgi:hypothetical protein